MDERMVGGSWMKNGYFIHYGMGLAWGFKVCLCYYLDIRMGVWYLFCFGRFGVAFGVAFIRMAELKDVAVSGTSAPSSMTVTWVGDLFARSSSDETTPPDRALKLYARFIY